MVPACIGYLFGVTIAGSYQLSEDTMRHLNRLADKAQTQQADAALIAAAPDMAALLNEWRCFVLHGSNRRYTEKEMLAWTNALLTKAGL